MNDPVDAVVAVWSVAALLYNSTGRDLARMLFPDAEPEYLAEWEERFLEGFPHAVGKMSTGTLRRFVRLALEKHGDAGRQFAAASLR